ncbi:MAG: CBS domain-containing protein [Phycisphaeraceae bacterium]
MKLANFPIHEAPRIAANATASVAYLTMHVLQARLLIICESGPDDPVGWLDEADLLAAVHRHADQLDRLSVQQLMVPQIDACYAHQTVAQVQALLRERCARVPAVFDAEERLLGVVRADDLEGSTIDRSRTSTSDLSRL